MSEPLVSIIVPIYKVEQYLDKCLRSISDQTYRNIEVLLINDGSPDNSAEIARKYAQNDSRFQYYEKENGGLSSARNYGIDRCKGDYISFVDSDDWLEAEFVKHLVEAAEKTKSDIAVCNMKYIYQDGSQRKNVPQIVETKQVTNIEALSDLFNSRYFRNHAQNKLYKRRLFLDTGIRYPVGKLYEDVFTTYKLFFEAQKVSYLAEALYDYLQARPGSILNSGFSNKQLDILEGLDNIKAFVEGNKLWPELGEDFAQLAISNILAIGNYIYPVYSDMKQNEKKQILEIIIETKNRYSLCGYYKCKNISFEQKLRYFMMLHAYTRQV